jgi:WD40 repeat protein
MVVGNDSATLGYPGETSVSMDADHHGVCKYESPRDPNYMKVRNYIKSAVANILQSGGFKGNNNFFARDLEDTKKLESLFGLSDPPDGDFIFFKDRWVRGTCNWILSDLGYVKWLHDDSLKPRVLWLHGGAASGKSVLSSFIINHLAQQNYSCQYFFIRFGDRNKRSLSTLLRSLAFQTTQSSPAFREKILKISDDIGRIKNSDAQTVWQRIFKEILFKTEIFKAMYWVIDGVDESDTPRRLIKMMSESSAASIPIRILLLSRKTREISTEFQKLSEDVKLDIIASDGHSEDFEKYVDQELDIPGTLEQRQRFAKRIVEGALGNFLWVHLAVRKINSCQTAAKREQALEQLPPGMDKLFDRMAKSIAEIGDEDDKTLASNILAWVTCALRGLHLTELLQALEMGLSQMPDLQRTIGDLCAGFVVVDNDGNVAMIHQTAREYLIGNTQRPFNVDRKFAHEQIYVRCMRCLKAVGLRAQIKSGRPPEFLDYAATSWFSHLCSGSQGSEIILSTLIKFLKSTPVLTWIQALASTRQLRVLIQASSYLNSYAVKRKQADSEVMPRDRQISEREMIEDWATDLVKIVGKFGTNLVGSPESIYKLIPPFCPQESMIYKLFGKREAQNLAITGFSTSKWDDSLARLQFGANLYAASLLAVGNSIAILISSGTVYLFHSSTFERIGTLNHGERIFRMQRNSSGSILVTYGFVTTKVWNVASRKCTAQAENPTARPRPHSIVFIDNDDTILLGSDDRRIRALSLRDSTPTWKVVSELGEEQMEGAIVNSPTCMELSPDGKLVALGYRGHPVSVWEVESPEHVGNCNRLYSDSPRGTGTELSADCYELRWHPYSNGQVIGLYHDGTVFKWRPYDEEYQEVSTGGGNLAISHDGNFLAVGDVIGRIKLYAIADLDLVYQLSSQDAVLDLTFSPDAHRFYDIRGSYANIWEPATLLRLSEQTERGSDSASEIESMAQKSIISENFSGGRDRVTAVASQLSGRLYCYGTEEGVNELFESRRGKVGELGRSMGFLTTEMAVWSDDGRYIAFSDISGKLTIKSVQPRIADVESWIIEDVLGKPIKIQGSILQLLFHTESTDLLVYTAMKLSIISIAARSVSQTLPLAQPMSLRWINHPADPTLLLAIGHGTIHVREWQSLEEIQRFIFSSPNEDYFSSWRVSVDTSVQPASPPDMGHGRRKSSTAIAPHAWEAQETVDRVLVTHDKSHILVQISSPVSRDEKAKEILLFEVSSLSTSGSGQVSMPEKAGIKFSMNEDPQEISESIKLLDLQSHSSTVLHPVPLPSDVASRIETPLAFISRSSASASRLIFLDADFWVCSWRFTSPTNAARRFSNRSIGGGDRGNEVKQHYFLPGDWISPDCVALLTVMGDGTVLYPRNGEIAVIRCSGVGG